MQPKKTFRLFVLIILVLLPLISAYRIGGIGYYSPIDYLENEWVLFTILFLIFLSAIFYTLNKTFKNPAVAMVIAFGLSVLISLAIAQRGLIDIYGGGEISSWALFIAVVIGIGFLIRFSAESFGRVGVSVIVFIIWFIFRSLYPEDLLPSLLINLPAFIGFYNFLTSIIGLLILIALAIALGGKGDPRTVYEGFADLFSKRTR